MKFYFGETNFLSFFFLFFVLFCQWVGGTHIVQFTLTNEYHLHFPHVMAPPFNLTIEHSRRAEISTTFLFHISCMLASLWTNLYKQSRDLDAFSRRHSKCKYLSELCPSDIKLPQKFSHWCSLKVTLYQTKLLFPRILLNFKRWEVCVNL